MCALLRNEKGGPEGPPRFCSVRNLQAVVSEASTCRAATESLDARVSQLEALAEGEDPDNRSG